MSLCGGEPHSSLKMFVKSYGPLFIEKAGLGNKREGEEGRPSGLDRRNIFQRAVSWKAL